jgi:hypothetical protein
MFQLKISACRTIYSLSLGNNIWHMFSGTVIDLDEAMGSNLGPNSSHATNNDSQATFPHPMVGAQHSSQEGHSIMQRRYTDKVTAL